jgi:D-alanine-D-alanine ligase
VTPPPTAGNVVVLFNDSGKLIKGEPRDLIADQGVVACARAMTESLCGSGYRATALPLRGDVEEALAPYPPDGWRVFNLAEGLQGRLFEEARIAWALEAMGYRFTGSGGEAIARSTDKARAKELLAARGLATPQWRLFSSPALVSEEDVAGLGFPLIVKPVAEDGSIGIGAEAVVQDLQGLIARVAHVASCHRQAALAERFVAGREFSISLWGDPVEVLPLAEIDFASFPDPHTRIVSFAAKWEKLSFQYANTPVRCPASVDAALAARLQRAALGAWEAIGCRGYARVDVRVCNGGIPQILEINCNPDISPDAGFFKVAQAAGWDYASMAGRILEMAAA